MSGRRWKVLAAAAGAQGAAAAIFQGLPSVGPQLGGEYGLGLAQLGLALSAVTFGMTLSLLAWGVLADKLGERRVIVTGLLLAAGALGGAALASSFSLLVVGLFVAGVACASANASSGRTIMGWFPAAERGTAMSVRHASLPVSAALAAAALPALASAAGARAALWGLAALASGGALVASVVLRNPPTSRRASARVRAIASDRWVWRLSAATGLLVVGQFLFIGLLVVYLHSRQGWSPAGAAAAFAALQLVGAAVRVLAGRWSDRRGDRIGTLRLLSLGIAAALFAAVVARQAGGSVEVGAVALAAVATSSWNGVASIAVAERAGARHSGTALGLYNTVVALASAVTVAGLAALAAARGWTAPLAVAALSGVAAFLVLSGGRERHATA
jgi:sugar phosphate permease